MSILPQGSGVRNIVQNWKMEVLPKKFFESTLLFEYTPRVIERDSPTVASTVTATAR